MKIVGLDFETANNYSASACSLGIAIYSDGEIIDSFEWYIKPSHRYNFFTNTHIHGIRKEDVADEEEFFFYYDKLSKILDDAVIVAHNARFDLDVLNSVCDVYGLEHFTNYYIDTVLLSRKIYPQLINHKLNTVSEYLGIDLSHHNAKSDAYACLLILLKSMEEYECYELKDFLKIISMRMNKNM